MGQSKRRDTHALSYDFFGDVQISLAVTTGEKTHFASRLSKCARHKSSISLVKQYLPFLLAMYFIFDSIHFISFHAGFNPIHHFYDPRIGFNPQFEKHCPHSGFPWSTSPGAWFWAPYQKSENSSTLVFFFSKNGQLSG